MARARDELTNNISPHFLDVRLTEASVWGNQDFVLGTTLTSTNWNARGGVLSPLALLDRARQFAAAANELMLVEHSATHARTLGLEQFARELDSSNHLFVIYFLYARSIELSLKAFLSCNDRSEKELRSSAFGHNLTACLQEAERVGLASVFPLNDGHRIVIHWISHPYAGKDLEYTKVAPGGARITEMPSVAWTAAVAQSFIDGLQGVCLRGTVFLPSALHSRP
jgi:hypothetical protein